MRTLFAEFTVQVWKSLKTVMHQWTFRLKYLFFMNRYKKFLELILCKIPTLCFEINWLRFKASFANHVMVLESGGGAIIYNTNSKGKGYQNMSKFSWRHSWTTPNSRFHCCRRRRRSTSWWASPWSGRCRSRCSVAKILNLINFSPHSDRSQNIACLR